MMGDVADQNALTSAVSWVQDVLIGSLASTIAIIAVASVGLLLLSGRLEIRRGVQVILGCFILFGASSIAAGIVQLLNGDGGRGEQRIAAPPIQMLPPPPPVVRNPQTYDPYAGAAVPAGR